MPTTTDRFQRAWLATALEASWRKELAEGRPLTVDTLHTDLSRDIPQFR